MWFDCQYGPPISLERLGGPTCCVVLEAEMMIPKKRIASWLGLILGAIGFAGCFVAIVGVWGIRAQLSQTTGDVFDRIDNIFLVVRDGVTKTQQRVEASKVTTQEIERSLKTWTKEESSERVTSRLHLRRAY